MDDRALLEAIARIIFNPRLTRVQIVERVARLLDTAGLAPALVSVEEETS